MAARLRRQFPKKAPDLPNPHYAPWQVEVNGRVGPELRFRSGPAAIIAGEKVTGAMVRIVTPNGCRCTIAAAKEILFHLTHEEITTDLRL